jgi:uncharacterized membrane protein YkvA (DUF1232 family)
VPWWLQLTIGVVGGLLLMWLALVAVLTVFGRGNDRITAREALRLLPDVIRLLRRLTADPAVPRSVRFGLAVLLGYLLLPVDLIPDFLPVIGYADDAVVVAVALRFVVRAAGPGPITQHWPGTPTGLATLQRLARLEIASTDPSPPHR